MAGLATAMGIGRFAFTPMLPLMQLHDLVSLRQGSYLASANYVGYLLGASLLFAFNPPPARAAKFGLAAVAVSTLAMAFTSSFSPLCSRFVNRRSAIASPMFPAGHLSDLLIFKTVAETARRGAGAVSMTDRLSGEPFARSTAGTPFIAPHRSSKPLMKTPRFCVSGSAARSSLRQTQRVTSAA
jgi:Uncharacterised MFS-type transporter YbfB